jgi:uncharacterized RDD family membrane protein YckC
MASDGLEHLSPQHFCTECGTPYAVTDLVSFGNATVCANCKPLFVQRMREGAAGSMGEVVYGGFWRRVVAQCVDSAVMFFMLLPVVVLACAFVLVSAIASGSAQATSKDLVTLLAGLLLLAVFFLAPIFYFVYFTKHGGSTPGKMLLGLKIVTASGGPVGTGRAIGRVFARGLSSAIFYIGDMMAGWDSQKRALHDRICETRVIRISPTLFGRRIGAFALDGLICAVFSWACLIAWNLTHHISFFVTTFDPASPGAAAARQFAETWQPTAMGVIFQLLYTVYFHSQKGATPGKMAAGLKVVDASGNRIGVGRAFARFLSSFVLSQYLTVGIGYSVAAFDQQCRALHDHISGTRVIRDFESSAPSA